MEDKAYELFLKYINSHSLMSKNAAKNCAFLEVEGRLEELSTIPGTENRKEELSKLQELIWEI